MGAPESAERHRRTCFAVLLSTKTHYFFLCLWASKRQRSGQGSLRDTCWSFEDEPLETIQTSLSRPGILTTKGWRILDAEREQRLSLPFQVPAADVAERFVFFQMPDITERCGPPAQVALKVVFAWRLGSSIKLAVEETKDASR
jgi:hypothetical protein